jgi:predicted TIM-barrel fold metal-dependent hydrolase
VVFATPTDLAAYKAHFDVLMTAFGAERLIWGSNWPVITLHGTFEAQIAIAEEYLASFGTAVRDKVMFKNALAFYRRHRPDRHHRD